MAEKDYIKKWIRGGIWRFYSMYFFLWVTVFVIALFPIEEGSYPYSSDNMNHVIITILAMVLILIIKEIIFSKRIDKVRNIEDLEERIYKFGMYNVYKVIGSGIPLYIGIIYLIKTPNTLIVLLLILLAIYVSQFPSRIKVLYQLDMTEWELETTLRERENHSVTKK